MVEAQDPLASCSANRGSDISLSVVNVDLTFQNPMTTSRLENYHFRYPAEPIHRQSNHSILSHFEYNLNGRFILSSQSSCELMGAVSMESL